MNGTRVQVTIGEAQQKCLAEFGFFVWFLQRENSVSVGQHIYAYVPTGEEPVFTETMVMGKQKQADGVDIYVCLDLKRIASAPVATLPKTLAEFMVSPVGVEVVAKFKAADTYMLLAESDAIMSQTGSVSIDGDGLKHSVQVVGMAAAYTKQKPEYRILDVEEALELIREYNAAGLTNEEDLVRGIVEYADGLTMRKAHAG